MVGLPTYACLTALAATTLAYQCTSAVDTNPQLINPPAMRLKHPQLCDDSVVQNSGYIDIDDETHVFFWHFGARQKQQNDTIPLVFWFSGGPGCSSQIANWQENGPCRYNANGRQVERNPFAWNSEADLIFIDQPIGAGFSYGQSPSSTEASADTAWLAMQAIYHLLSPTKGRDMYMFGESYAGRYLPAFAEYVWHMNQRAGELKERGFMELPLRGVGIGNGMFDVRLQSPSHYTIGCVDSQFFTADQCQILEDDLMPRCQSLLDKCQQQPRYPQASASSMRLSGCTKLVPEPWRTSRRACRKAVQACSQVLDWTNSVSSYDIRPNATLVPDQYIRYLRSPEFIKSVGANSSIRFEECSDPVFDAFMSTADEASRSSMSSLEFLLDSNVPVLLYAGDVDFICNWRGNMAVARALRWHGQERFNDATTSKWQGNKGEVTAFGNLNFLRVYQAGHEVPYYQPEASLQMLTQFMQHKNIQ